LRDSPSLQDLLEVQKHFDLPSPVLVEKDWYVVRALAAINSAEVKPFRLVFSGGTALSRAHRLTRRMSARPRSLTFPAVLRLGTGEESNARLAR